MTSYCSYTNIFTGNKAVCTKCDRAYYLSINTSSSFDEIGYLTSLRGFDVDIKRTRKPCISINLNNIYDLSNTGINLYPCGDMFKLSVEWSLQVTALRKLCVLKESEKFKTSGTL